MMDYFTSTGHLSTTGLSLAADALKLGQEEQLPEPLRSHLSECAQCQHEVAELYQLVSGLDYHDLPDHPTLGNDNSHIPPPVSADDQPVAPPPPPWRHWRWWLMLGLAGLSWWVYQQQHTATLPSAPTPTPATPADTLVAPPRDTVVADDPPRRPIAKQEPAPATPSPGPFAANFTPNEEWESLAGSNLRDGSLRVDEPRLGQAFDPGATIRFVWAGEAGELLWKMRNNLGQEVDRVNVTSSPHLWTAPARPGRYYWSLENEEELRYVGTVVVGSPTK